MLNSISKLQTIKLIALQILGLLFFCLLPLGLKVFIVPEIDFLVILWVWIPSVCIIFSFLSSKAAGILTLLYFSVIQTRVLTDFDFSREAVTAHQLRSLMGNQIFHGIIVAIVLIIVFYFVNSKLNLNHRLKQEKIDV